MSTGESAPPKRSCRSLVASLTDEELDVLCDGAHDVVVLPHLSTLEQEQARLARRVAERSLAARGLLSPVSLADPQTVAVHPLLAPLLQMRRGAPVVVVLHRTATAELSSSAAQARFSLTRYLFVLDGACVCEDVTAHGVHTLSMARAEHLADVLVEFLVPPGASAPPGTASVQGDPADLPGTLRRLGDPVVLAESTVLHPWVPPGQAPARLLLLGPSSCFHAALGQAGRWVCRPASPEGLVGLLVDEVAAACGRVAQERGEDNGGCD